MQNQDVILPETFTHAQNRSDFVEFLSKNALALTLQGVGVVVLLANLWLAAQLAPLAESIREVKADQNRTDTQLEKYDGLFERFVVVEQKVKTIDDNVRDVQSDVKLLLRSTIEREGTR